MTDRQGDGAATNKTLDFPEIVTQPSVLEGLTADCSLVFTLVLDMVCFLLSRSGVAESGRWTR